jgi:hypothetical protein
MTDEATRQSSSSDAEVRAKLIAGAGRNKRALKAFFFLRDHADSARPFTLEELGAATGWTGQTPGTYATKQWAQLLEAKGNGTFVVKPDFKRLSSEQFLRRFTQKKPIYSEYGRVVHPHVVIYEFLLPLTRETQLRDALEELFYLDALSQRINELGIASLEKVVPRLDEESDVALGKRITAEINERFGGYSIVHVQGRFRAADLTTRASAGDMLAVGERYLIDETTASVRFVVPCQVSRKDFDSNYLSVAAAVGQGSLLESVDVDEEVSRIRGLFFSFFVEAVVKTVMGEEEIWLIETTHHGTRLFVWKRQTPR